MSTTFGIGVLAKLTLFALFLAPRGDKRLDDQVYPANRSLGSSVTFAVSGRNPAEVEVGVRRMACCQEPIGDVKNYRLEALRLDPSGHSRSRELLPNAQQIERIQNQLLVDALKAHNQGKAIHFVCHSWGATMCLSIAQELERRNVHPETMILIDPIQLGYPHVLLPQNDQGSGFPVVPSTVDHVFVVTQEHDPGFVPGPGIQVAPGTNVTRVILNDNMDNPEGSVLLQQVLMECQQIPGCSPNSLHPRLDDSKIIRDLASADIGRPCVYCCDASDCDDGIACTRDEFQNNTCVYTPDDMLCNPNATAPGVDPDADCVWSVCSTGSPNADGNGCAINGVELNGSPCDDGRWCTVSDFCQQHFSGDLVCGGYNRTCADSDSNLCTFDYCDYDADACAHVASCSSFIACGSGSFCDGPPDATGECTCQCHFPAFCGQ